MVLDARKIADGPIGSGTKFVQRARSFGQVGVVDQQSLESLRRFVEDKLPWDVS
jgi:hypothetical protein